MYETDDYSSQHLPDGFNTVMGYLAATNPEAVALLEDPGAALDQDEAFLDNQCLARTLASGVTVAPRALRGSHNTVRFYPVALLRERLGD